MDSQQILAALNLDQWPQHWRGMARVAEARAVIPVGRSPYGRVVFLAPPAAGAWVGLSAAARGDGIDLLPISGYRSFQRQLDLVQAKLRQGQSLDAVLAVNALPGFSEHHSGLALDLGVADAREHLSEVFERSSAFEWLTSHAARFGFQMSYPRGNAAGIAYEPWHWCYRGGWS